MSQPLSIRFQPPDQLSGPARDLLAFFRRTTHSGPIIGHGERIEPLALPPSREQAQLNARALRCRLRALEQERALKTVDGTATWIITDRMCLNPDLGERIGPSIVATGVGKGRIVYGPADLCLPAGRYMAVIEFQVTNMADRRWARVTGEVILNNQKYLSQQTKALTAPGTYAFRLPFRVREDDLLRHATPMIEVRLNLRNVVGVTVRQVAILSKAPGLRTLAAHPVAHLNSAGNAWLKWVARKIAKPRVTDRTAVSVTREH